MRKIKDFQTISENRDDPGDKLVLDWPAIENNMLFREILEGMKKIAGKIDKGGEKRVFTPLWDFDDPAKSTAIALHPIGGCTMGRSQVTYFFRIVR